MKVFVDTSALYALVDDGDPHHGDAVGSLQRVQGSADLLTHNYVLVEAISLVRRRLGASAELHLMDVILPIVRTIWIDELTHRAATTAYRAASRSGSLVDYVSFEVMRQAGVEVAFAYDRDFERQGFRPVAGSTPDAPERRLSEAPAPYESDTAPESHLVGIAEIAARSGRSTNTIQSWRRRHPDFPTPVAQLATGPVWSWTPVAEWIAARTRHSSIIRSAEPRKLGLLRGEILIAPDFDEPIPEIEAAFYSRPDQPTIPLFESGIPDLAERADDYLEGFGER
jgi:Predicted nucleic acid-binding protein, contains PIN domain